MLDELKTLVRQEKERKDSFDEADLQSIGLTMNEEIAQLAKIAADEGEKITKLELNLLDSKATIRELEKQWLESQEPKGMRSQKSVSLN